MRVKIYRVYYNGEIEKEFLLKRSAKKYKELLEFYKINEKDEIYYRRGYLYV